MRSSEQRHDSAEHSRLAKPIIDTPAQIPDRLSAEQFRCDYPFNLPTILLGLIQTHDAAVSEDHTAVCLVTGQEQRHQLT